MAHLGERHGPRGHGLTVAFVHDLCYVHDCVNGTNNVNENRLTGAALERALLRKLQEIIGDIGWLDKGQHQGPTRAGGADATVRLALQSGSQAQLHVHVKSEMRPGIFPAWAAARSPSAPGQEIVPVLAMPFVSARLAELCQRANWSWFDLSGNCWLDLPGRFRVERSGNPPVHRPPRRGANLSTPAAARVMRVLLSPANAGRAWTQRQIRDETTWEEPRHPAVSLGLVNKVLRYLRDAGYLADTDGRATRVQDPVGLLRAWNEAYRFSRHERLSFFTLLRRAELEKGLWRTGLEAGGMAAYAAFSAAERQAPQVRQPQTWLYLASEFIGAFARNTEAKEVDSGENLVVLVPEDVGVFLSFEGDGHVDSQVLGCTDPVQTYVDLMHCGGRGEEAAQAVLDQRILPPWKARVPA